MTGQKMAELAAIMLGYSASNGNLKLDERIIAKAPVLINRIYSDLWHICYDKEFVPLEDLSEEINLPSRVQRDVMPFGVAMLFAQSESDGDHQQVYAQLYNKKRASLSETKIIEDFLARGIIL